MSYTTKPLSKENCKDLKSLYKKVFNIKMSVRDIHKKFDSSSFDKPYFGHIAYFQNNPVAFYGAIIMEMNFNGQRELSAQSVDSMTIKEHSGKGLFTKLAFLTFTDLEKNNITFIWGFANQNSENPALKKLGYTSKEKMMGFSIASSPFPFESVFRKNKITSKLYDFYIRKIISAYTVNNIVKNSASLVKDSVTVIRNATLYDSKSNNGNFSIKIDNVIFWIKVKQGLHIGDIEIIGEGDFSNAFIKLKKKAFLLGIRTITIQASPNTFITEIFKEIPCRTFDSWSICYKNFSSSFPLERLRLTYGDIDSF